MADLLTLIVKFRNKEYTLICLKFIPSMLNIKIGIVQKKNYHLYNLLCHMKIILQTFIIDYGL